MVDYSLLGSLPGKDYRSAVQATFDRLPDSAPIPELPDRGAHAHMIGRSIAMLSEFPVELGAAGWRLSSGRGDEFSRRAHSTLRSDLDQVEEFAQGWQGELRLTACGPLTLAACLETMRGQKCLSDEGISRDLAQSLGEGLANLVAELSARLPSANLTLQMDEPMADSVLTGGVATPSGLKRYPPLDADLAATMWRSIISVVPTEVTVHSCGKPYPWQLATLTGVQRCAPDVSTTLGEDVDQLGAWFDTGAKALLGVVAADRLDHVPSVESIVEKTLRLLERTGLPEPVRTAEMDASTGIAPLVITPSCGLARWSAPRVMELLSALREASLYLTEKIGS